MDKFLKFVGFVLVTSFGVGLIDVETGHLGLDVLLGGFGVAIILNSGHYLIGEVE